MDQATPRDDKRPAWREPMVWVVFAIPAIAIVFTLTLFGVASRSSGNNDAVADRVQRTAQVQVADLGPDATAKRLGLIAAVRVSGDRIEVLPVAGTFDRTAPLTLALRHPARAEDDRDVTLAPGRDGWQATGGVDLAHDWNLQLAPADGRWRLQGRWTAHHPAATLRPALDGAQ